MRRLVRVAFSALLLGASGLSLGVSALHAATKPRLVEQTPHNIVSPGSLAGRYRVFRENEKDTGCLVTLESAGRGRAYLSPACRDQGMVIFDPVAWSYSGGWLVLTARGGHQARFELENTGYWVKEAKEGGKPLMLRKIED
ncbi:AprI/Inh family metalloprotease inhibitor [Methylovirgula sp. 4M-Z18]|uniref:AprI/Inh family metalloprotease inhibitor n=1 Tax=Methylovirgula sp. 4M-Z18 TaxID=2293567 RepID=UPI000E2FDD7E|nr:AprI/Inh family metalloprotease inhibitor [Methylovirgula sp. 4M-Z18]RFB78004.1 hypothetical protein DYH55_18490 [Methylovirgula sp. 4M-Z18]